MSGLSEGGQDGGGGSVSKEDDILAHGQYSANGFMKNKLILAEIQSFCMHSETW